MKPRQGGVDAACTQQGINPALNNKDTHRSHVVLTVGEKTVHVTQNNEEEMVRGTGIINVHLNETNYHGAVIPANVCSLEG